MVDDAVNSNSEKKMPAQKNKQANESACAIDNANNRDKKEITEVKLESNPVKQSTMRRKKGSDEEMTITKINKI
eukprot:5899953-Ditylum_brightwellii.AAC.1